MKNKVHKIAMELNKKMSKGSMISRSIIASLIFIAIFVFFNPYTIKYSKTSEPTQDEASQSVYSNSRPPKTSEPTQDNASQSVYSNSWPPNDLSLAHEYVKQLQASYGYFQKNRSLIQKEQAAHDRQLGQLSSTIQCLIDRQSDQCNPRVQTFQNILLHGVQNHSADDESDANQTDFRRQMITNTRNLRFYFQSRIWPIITQYPILSAIREDIWTLTTDVERLVKSSEAESWRKKELISLQNLMQKRIYYLQNPSNCTAAKKLIYDVSAEGCGFSCQAHHMVYNFVIAYGLQRTFVLKSKGWKYASLGWETVFQPVSETCSDLPHNSTPYMFKNEPDSLNLEVVYMNHWDNPPKYILPHVPSDLVHRLSQVHGEPHVWFIGQFLKYLMRPQKTMDNLSGVLKDENEFDEPIVGVHIRRTDKIRDNEAKYHSLEMYMDQVEEWFLIQERVKGHSYKRRLYMASDDPNVLAEARKRYPMYDVIGDISIMQSARVSSRYSELALRGVITDIYLLSLCDFLVCTFSSNVCRAAYELMQTLGHDSAHSFHSLDDDFWFYGQTNPTEVVLHSHLASNKDEIDFSPGDVILIRGAGDGNQWNGYSRGQNLRTGKAGVYPSFKTKKIISTIYYPTYVNATEDPQDAIDKK